MSMRISSLLNEDGDHHQVQIHASTQRDHRKPTRSSVSAQDRHAAQVTTIQVSTPGSRSTPRCKNASQTESSIIKGEVRYAPFECYKEEMMRKIRKFDLKPAHGVASYPKRIPYSSEKKAFHTQTGRDSFEVFQYTFKHRDASKEWTVMWDYNIGLVRITPFFKALGYAKTIPAKAIAMTPGLKEMSHSITGGALAAQGYWMPFEAAKALAAKFCWEIRYALIPLFGSDFINMCTKPEHQDANDFTIDQQIVEACREEVKSWTQPERSKRSQAPYTPVRRMLLAPTSHPKGLLASDEDISPMDTRPRSPSPTNAETVSSAETIKAAKPTFIQPIWRAVNTSPSPSMSASASSPSPAPSSTALSTTNTNDSTASKRTRSDVDDVEANSIVGADRHAGRKRRRVRKSPGKFGAAEVRAAYALMGLRDS